MAEYSAHTSGSGSNFEAYVIRTDGDDRSVFKCAERLPTRSAAVSWARRRIKELKANG